MPVARLERICLHGPVHNIARCVDTIPEVATSKTMTLNVRADLIRRDMARMHAKSFEHLKAELTRAFAAPESTYRPLDADEVIRRNARRAPA